MRILVVEDELKVANALREGLQGERYDVVVERTGESAFFRVTTEQFDAILLDLTLPGRDGLEILKAMRDRGIKTPVLVLTARDSLQDRVARPRHRRRRLHDQAVCVCRSWWRGFVRSCAAAAPQRSPRLSVGRPRGRSDYEEGSRAAASRSI